MSDLFRIILLFSRQSHRSHCNRVCSELILTYDRFSISPSINSHVLTFFTLHYCYKLIVRKISISRITFSQTINLKLKRTQSLYSIYLIRMRIIKVVNKVKTAFLFYAISISRAR